MLGRVGIQAIWQKPACGVFFLSSWDVPVRSDESLRMLLPPVLARRKLVAVPARKKNPP